MTAIRHTDWPFSAARRERMTAREVVAEQQALREAAREFNDPRRWGAWWTLAPQDRGPGWRPLPPVVHRVATDRCEQQQADGTWHVAERDLCQACEAQHREQRATAEAARLHEHLAAQRRLQAHAAETARRQAQATWAEWRAQWSPGPFLSGTCPHCSQLVRMPLQPPGEYRVQHNWCGGLLLVTVVE